MRRVLAAAGAALTATIFAPSTVPAQTAPSPDSAFDALLKNLKDHDPTRLQTPQKQHAVARPTRPLTTSDLDLVKQQIESCWTVRLPPGATPENPYPGGAPVSEFRVYMNPDGTVRRTQWLNPESDRQAAADAEAVLRDRRCQPFTPLLRAPYAQWKSFTITFDPRDVAPPAAASRLPPRQGGGVQQQERTVAVHLLGAGVVQQAIVCPSADLTQLAYEWVVHHRMDSFANAITNGTYGRAYVLTPPPQLAALGCAIFPLGTPAVLDRCAGVPNWVTVQLPDGASMTGAALMTDFSGSYLTSTTAGCPTSRTGNN